MSVKYAKNAAVVFTYREKYSDGANGNNPLNLANSSVPLGNIQTILNAAARIASDNNLKPIDGQWMFGNVVKQENGILTVNTKKGMFEIEENLAMSLCDWEVAEQDRKDKLDFLDQLENNAN